MKKQPEHSQDCHDFNHQEQEAEQQVHETSVSNSRAISPIGTIPLLASRQIPVIRNSVTACLPVFSIRRTCPQAWLRTDVMSVCPPTAVTACFRSPLLSGCCFSCNHIYSQYVFIDDAQEILQQMEKTSRNMLSLSRYSRSNAVNHEWTEMFLDEAHTQGLLPVRCHCNVLAWADDGEELRRIKNDTGSQLALMGCVPRHNTVDTPVLYWSGIPGNAGDFPAEESFHTFLEQAVCLFASETNYRSSPSPFGIRMADRRSGVPGPPGHQRPAHAEGNHHQPQQVHTRTFGKRQVLLHEPPCPAILRTRIPYPAGGYRK